MFDLKVINSVLTEMEEERGIPREKMLDAIEQSLATAYKKEFGKRGQIITCSFDMDTGTTNFNQIKIVVDESMLKPEPELDEEGNPIEEEEPEEEDEENKKVRFDEEKHIMISTAKMIKKDVELGEELVFPLEPKDDFGRIAAQTAKQVIMQKIREAEKESALAEFGQKAGDIVIGHAQRFERGNLYVDLGRVTAIMPYEEQIPGERFKPGERIRAILLAVEETPRGIFLKLSRSHPDFLTALFAIEAPELQTGAVEVKAVAREAGARSKIAVHAVDEHIDPVGSLVGQRGVRVSTVMSELGGEKIDIIEWSPVINEFIEDALSPAQVMEIRIETEPNEEEGERGHAIAEVAGDQQSLAIGRGGQNVRLAAKLTGWKIDIVSAKTGEELAEADAEGNVELEAPSDTDAGKDDEVLESEDATTTEPDLEEVLEEEDDTKDRDMTEGAEAEGEDEIDTPEEAEDELAPAIDEEVAKELEEEETK
ncbi:transcription termination/antitermination protein NusA [Candidatus Kaiserbacteria bacterium]|nr:transcription termination/antitermination protein NusA [Candidatus Kaiserbacteria bacterium]MCB9817896.1 transcription termination/antitermination protein NusA [Candidatus Nomurabacteria bacterium]